ncbi:MAG: hypothetical protein KDI13_03955 [Alphaproteobacteria bacterium]|nr:hypothetical protein [Alphaproteobacteria bacterium]
MKNKMPIISAMTLGACLLLTNPAQAYVGPGAAVVLIGYIFGPIVAVITAVGLVFLWPLYYLWKKIKSKKKKSADKDTSDSEPTATAEERETITDMQAAQELKDTEKP